MEIAEPTARQASALFGLLGWLPIAAALGGYLTVVLGERAVPRDVERGRRLESWVAGGIIVCVGAASTARLLAQLGWFGPYPILALALLVAVVAWRGRAPHQSDSTDPRPDASRLAVALPLLVGAAAIVGTAMSAWLLPVWQWDSLGYHLPFVNWVLERGRLSDVPIDVPYLSTYPHVVEYLFCVWRSLLPDDRLIDAAQIPFGVLGALATALLAIRLGATERLALAAGALWLAIPIVFLQMATNYIDVAAGAFFLCGLAWLAAPPTRARLVLATLALGLFLGGKPSAPVALAPCLLVLVWRVRQIEPRWFLASAVLTLCVVGIGGESLLTNLFRHGNPVWPVELHLGPWTLPGPESMQNLLQSGAAAPKPVGSLVERLWQAYTKIGVRPAFDMKLGGFGPLFLLVLPVAIVACRRRLGWLLLLGACWLAADPAIARYTIALPAVALALCAVELTGRPSWAQGAGLAFASVLGALGLYLAWPGLIGEGPTLSEYLPMTPAERMRAVGAAGRPAPYVDAREALPPGQSAAYDASFDLPYSLWRHDLGNRVFRFDSKLIADPPSARRWLDENKVGLVAVRTGGPLAAELVANGWVERTRCLYDPCMLYMRAKQ